MAPRPTLPLNPRENTDYDFEPVWQESPTVQPPSPPLSACPPVVALVEEPVKEAADPAAEEEPARPTSGALERDKACLAALLVVVLFASTFLVLAQAEKEFEAPTCSLAAHRTCLPCSSGGFLLPAFGEYEQSWPSWLRSVLYFLGLLWVFMGVGIVCDQFMAAIEEITSSEKTIWHEVHSGARRKFHIKTWNGTIANLSLMALGSSAPEILLSATELCMDGFFAGTLGPSTIVGSAAFNLLMISAVCVSAIDAPLTKRIEGTDVYLVTTVFSILAYLWLPVILSVSSPDKVELWESVVTLLMFPLLLVLAFVADKGWLRRRRAEDPDEVADRMAKIQARLGKELPGQTLRLMVAAEMAAEEKPKVSRAALRKVATSAVTGARRDVHAADVKKSSASARAACRELIFGFREARHVVLEDVGVLSVKVVANREPAGFFEMGYETREGTAKANKRYQHVSGSLTFGHRQTEQSIQIPILDNNTWEDEEEFYVVLTDLKAGVRGYGRAPSKMAQSSSESSSSHPGVKPKEERRHSLGDAHFGIAMTTISVLNDDMPGTLGFDADEIMSYEGTYATIGVMRTGGSCGKISCDYATQDAAAIEGKDYEGVSGTLEFEPGETHKTISVKILVSEDHEFEDAESFKVVLSNPSPGVKFDPNTDGGERMAIIDVIIAADREPTCWMRFVRRFWNRDRTRAGLEQWKEQFAEAFYCSGGPEDQAAAGPLDWFFHILTLAWKLLFAFVPPPLFCGGWLCFLVALLNIGATTAIVGELASLLGCSLGIEDEVTAITLVSLGTSLPDTFASRAAARHDDTADNSIGNIMGSNSVNVFLGLGISWTIGCAYWGSQGVTEAWENRLYRGRTFKELYPQYWSTGGGFIYPAGNLLFSVGVYCATAFCCIALLAYRRRKYGGELGGPEFAQRRDSVLLASLWVVYILASTVYIYA